MQGGRKCIHVFSARSALTNVFSHSASLDKMGLVPTLKAPDPFFSLIKVKLQEQLSWLKHRSAEGRAQLATSSRCARHPLSHSGREYIYIYIYILLIIIIIITIIYIYIYMYNNNKYVFMYVYIYIYTHTYIYIIIILLLL